MDLDDYQQRAAETDVRPDPGDIGFPLLGLAGEVGELVTEYKKRLRSGGGYVDFHAELGEELGDLMWYAATLATTAGLSLSDVAEANLRKTRAAWTRDLPPPAAYDEGYPAGERFPRSFTIRFRSYRDDKGLERVAMHLGGHPVGDPLDDNAVDEDNYRFHDALHLAHAAVLGWSPTLRMLLGRKRKSNQEVDRVQDGARAIALEEGLVAQIFSFASQHGFFENSNRVDWDLLKDMKRVTAHLEVTDQPHSAWQHAILNGFSVWRQLRARGGGLVEVNLDHRELAYLD